MHNPLDMVILDVLLDESFLVSDDSQPRSPVYLCTDSMILILLSLYCRVCVTATLADRSPPDLHLFRNYPSPQAIIGASDYWHPELSKKGNSSATSRATSPTSPSAAGTSRSNLHDFDGTIKYLHSIPWI